MKKTLLAVLALLLANFANAQCNPTFTNSINGYDVTFTNTTNYTNTAPPVYMLMYGDGGVSTPFYPVSSVTHTYAAQGTYTAELFMSVFDSLNNSYICMDSTFATIVIGNGGGTTTNNHITGTVSIDSNSSNSLNPIFKIWLIKYDSLAQTLTAVDSLLDSASWYATGYEFTNEPAGVYFVKAAVVNGPTSGTGPVPTYGYSSLYWSSANTIYLNTTGTQYMDIMLQQGTVTSGPGFVGGSISAGANKGTHVTGVPVANMLVFLEDQTTGNVIKYAYTDANGDYSFSNLAIGNYKVYPEEMGYQTTAWANVEVTATQTTADQVNFTEHTVSKTITPNNVGIANVAAANSNVSVFPNPTFGQISINTPENAQVCVTDMVGHILLKNSLSQGANAVNISSLSSGIYLITIKGDHVNYTNKITLQH